ncbi:hypothetical protein, partial [Schlesneria sp.]|uniref:hypothetical protein n=1 Tax=Schlesneria sp. TaxID=2762018 RepID=UPI002EF8C6C1
MRSQRDLSVRTSLADRTYRLTRQQRSPQLPAASTAKERSEFWAGFFQDEVSPETVRDVVAELVESRKHEDVIS